MKLQVSLQFVAFNHSGVYSYCLQVFELTDQCRNQFSKPKSKLKVLNASSQPLPLQPEHKELNKTALNKSSSPIENETMGLLLLAGVSLNGQRELSPPAPQPSTCTAAWRGAETLMGWPQISCKQKEDLSTLSPRATQVLICAAKQAKKSSLFWETWRSSRSMLSVGRLMQILYCIIVKHKCSYNVKIFHWCWNCLADGVFLDNVRFLSCCGEKSGFKFRAEILVEARLWRGETQS